MCPAPSARGRAGVLSQRHVCLSRQATGLGGAANRANVRANVFLCGGTAKECAIWLRMECANCLRTCCANGCTVQKTLADCVKTCANCTNKCTTTREICANCTNQCANQCENVCELREQVYGCFSANSTVT
eukprot:gene18283-biopygen17390